MDCERCGRCCAMETCRPAQALFMTDATGPCPALEWENHRATCGLVAHPKHYLDITLNRWKEDDEKKLQAFFINLLHIGKGCDDNWREIERYSELDVISFDDDIPK